jgi:hypothetical protein
LEERTEGNKPELDLVEPAPERPEAKVKSRRKRSFKVDKEELVKYVLETLTRNEEDRAELINRRMDRAAKVRGWLPEKTFPWTGCANFPVPIMAIANLKVRGVLENALKSYRPMLDALAKQGRNSGKEKAITQLLDFQFFVENRGEAIIDDAVANFVEDEALFLFTKYVKEDQTLHDTRILPPWPQDSDITVSALESLKVIYGGRMISQAMTDEDGWDWTVQYQDENNASIIRYAYVCFYEMDDLKIQACISAEVTVHDGPNVSVLDFEDVVYPARAANLQAPSATNPNGAAHFDILFNVSLDTIYRRFKDKTYDQMTEEDWETIKESRSPEGSGEDNDNQKELKDSLEGSQVTSSDREDRQGIMRFDRLDVNDDGFEEDVIIWCLRDSKVLLKVALLTEIYPGLPIRRPVAHESFMSVVNRIAGQSQSELLEAMQDATQVLLDQHIDWGTITNTPFGLYRAASGIKAENIHIEPGVLVPVDNPQTDVVFPQWPTKDSSYALNTIAVIQQFIERISMSSDVDLGRVPQGKASALRTASTVQALLGQSSGRSEQVLRRLFHCFEDVFEMMHRLNIRYLPDEKEVRIQGMAEAGQDAYATIKPDQINAEVDFSFKATLLNSTKQAVAAAISEVVPLIMSPLAVQAGVVSVEQVYNVMKTFIESRDLDPNKYLMRPIIAMSGPKLLAEEVLSTLMAGEIPVGQPAEDPMMHLQKLTEFASGMTQATLEGVPMGPAIGMFSVDQTRALQLWMSKVQMLLMQQQQLMAAMGSGSGGGGGQPQEGEDKEGEKSDSVPANTTGENPQVNSGEMIDESMSPSGMPQQQQ